MKSIKTFFRTFFLSLTSPAYYADVVKTNFSFSMKYFFFINVLVSLLVISKVLVPVAAFDVQGVVDKAVSVFPSDLVVSINHGQLSINKPLPYAIPMPAFWSSQKSADRLSDYRRARGTDADQFKNLVVFDSDEHVQSIRDFDKYQTVALVTETSIYSRKNSSTHEITAMPIPEDAENFQINSQQVAKVRQAILEMPVIKNKLYVPLIAVILLFAVVPLMIVGRLIALFVFSVFMYFVVRLLQKSTYHNYSYSLTKVFQVSLHSVTLIILIKLVSELLGQGHLIEGLLYFIILAVWTGIALWKASEIMMTMKSGKAMSQPVPQEKKKPVVKKKK